MKTNDIEKENNKSGYWKAVPKNKNDIFDNNDYEIVYVYFENTEWTAFRIGIEYSFPLSYFTFLNRID